jgi:LmbE family N-acetylglucosaminyl deacetylase
VIRRTAPDLVITHYSGDYMSDHNATSRLVFDASFWAASRHFEADRPQAAPLPKPPALVYMDTVAGVGFLPQEYVDVSEVMETKIAMLAQHRSQLDYMRERDGLDLLDCMKTVARYRGYQCGKAFAEGFVPERVYPSLSSQRWLP